MLRKQWNDFDLTVDPLFTTIIIKDGRGTRDGDEEGCVLSEVWKSLGVRSWRASKTTNSVVEARGDVVENACCIVEPR